MARQSLVKRAARKTRHKIVRGSIDRERIVRAGLTLLERGGIAGVSTRRVAEMLGIAGPSLYWHFRNKRELLNHMAEAILAESQPSPDPLVAEKDWRVWLKKAGQAYRAAATSRRDAAQLLAGARATGTHPALNYQATVARLRREGFSKKHAPYVFWSVGRFALGWTVRELGGGFTPQKGDEAFEFGLSALIDGFDKHLRRR